VVLSIRSQPSQVRFISYPIYAPTCSARYKSYISEVQVIQTQNVSKFSSQFQIKAMAAGRIMGKKVRSDWHIVGSMVDDLLRLPSSNGYLWSPTFVNHFSPGGEK
jgi:hypothetical protein